MKKGRGILRAVLCAIAVLCVVLVSPDSTLTASAGGLGTVMLENPYVTSWQYPNELGEMTTYWTIETPKVMVQDEKRNRGKLEEAIYRYGWENANVPPYWYPMNTRVTTGIASSLRELQVGEHYYRYLRVGDVPVGYWQVAHPWGGCIHTNNDPFINGVEGGAPGYAGKRWTPGICGKTYPSGWFAYCADCGEVVTCALIYATQGVISTMGSFDSSLMYVYGCPHCGGLETQGSKPGHDCRAISWNKYKVVYEPNAGVDYTGHMEPSFHMYNNETMHNGEPVTPIKHLSPINYQREGYTFVGWNTKPDGTGTFYADRAEIFNLSVYDFEADEFREGTDKGVITLYAQWKDTKSILHINTNGGTFEGQGGIIDVKKGYGESKTLNPSSVVPPKGVTVHFNPQNGKGMLPDRTSDMVFSTWQESVPLNGKFKNNKYIFYGADGTEDTITAIYDYGSIILPDAPEAPTRPDGTKPSFGGWSKDPDGRYPVGGPGDRYTPLSECTLYAQWSTLVLESVENYVANEKKGACDLTWIQPDTLEKSYLVYRSDDSEHFSQLYAADIDYDRMSVDKTYDYSGTASTYVIPYDGYYKLDAWGAQGANYSASRVGGKGGFASGTFYLTAGDKLTIKVGGQNGYNGGGSGTIYKNGGGMTSVVSKQYGVLVIAGGGGGASANESGGGGGLSSSLRTDNERNGATGSSGGGAGYVGGNAGAEDKHQHVDTCNVLHHHTAACGGGGPIYHVHDSSCPKTTYNYCAAESWHSNTAPFGVIETSVWHPGEGTVESVNCNGGDHSTCSVDCRWCAAKGHNCVYKTVTNCPTSTTTPIGYEPWGCGLAEGAFEKYSCGYTQGQIIPSSVKGAHGGSSFVQTSGVNYCAYETRSAEQTGNGKLVITSYEVGFTTELKLDGAESPDLAAPDRIDLTSVVKKAVSSSEIKLTFDRPKDNGTDYWWQVKSYQNKTKNHLLDSNITKNTLTTGVKGYYYVYDYDATHGVDFIANQVNGGVSVSYRAKGSDPVTDTVSVTTQPSTTYLHIAAVDVAGNVAKTIDIKIDPGVQAYPIVTEQIQISATINGKDQGTVYQSPLDGKIYVRADGAGAFKLSYNSFMDGAARADYQINRQTFAIAQNTPGTEARFVSHLPYSNPIKSGTDVLPLSGVARYLYGANILKDVQNFGATRENSARKNYFEQCFAVYPSYDGKVLVVTPVAGASVGDDEDDTVTSEWGDDILHSITLYPDGKAPVVTGLDALEGMATIDRTLGMPVFDVTCTDALSGVRSWVIEVANQNTGESKRYYPDGTGHICLDFNDANYALFDGDLTVTVTAVDNVGNRYEKTYGTQVFTLHTRLGNVVSPADNHVMRNGIARLDIVTRGYADRVVVELPPELLPGNEGLQLEYNYPTHSNFYEDEILLIRIPKDCPLTTYTVRVTAYKGGEIRQSDPQLIVIDGNAFGDVRVRIR